MDWQLIAFVTLLIVTLVDGGCTSGAMNVRLVGGSVEGVGRLEIKGNLEKWGSVCMDNWSPVNALVVCRQLCGDGNNAETISATNTPGVSPPPNYFTNVRCMGVEKSITECPLLEDWNLRCNTRNRVGISCVKRSCAGGGGGLSEQLGISAQCEPGAMVAFVNKSSNDVLVDSFALSPHLDPTCTNGQNGSNGTHLWLRLPYTKCGQLVAENDTWKSFMTRFRIEALSGGPATSTLTDYFLPVKCALNKITNQVIHVVGNVTSGQNILDNIEIGLKLKLNIRLFHDVEYTNPLQFPAYDLALGTPLYVRLELDPKQLQQNGTKLIVKDCVGMPEADTSDAALQEYIIKDSCPVEESSDIHRVPTPHRVHFKFQTFKFGPNYDKLYMSCSATVCAPGDTTNSCRPLCANMQHPPKGYSLTLGKRAENNQGEVMPSSTKPPQSMGGRSDMMMLRNPEVTQDWPLNPTGDVCRVDKNGRAYLLSNKGRLMRLVKNCNP